MVGCLFYYAYIILTKNKHLLIAEISTFKRCFCCPGRTRTLTGGTRIRSATITPLDNFLLFCKGNHFFLQCQRFIKNFALSSWLFHLNKLAILKMVILLSYYSGNYSLIRYFFLAVFYCRYMLLAKDQNKCSTHKLACRYSQIKYVTIILFLKFFNDRAVHCKHLISYFSRHENQRNRYYN